MGNNKQCTIFETYNAVNELKQTNKDGLITLSGVFGVCGTLNNNKRIYEKGNYGKMIAEMQERIKREGGVAGTLEHENSMYVTLENVSHKITKVAINKEGVVSGEIQLLNTPKGKIAQAIVEGGLPLFISSRAQGVVGKDGVVTLEKLSTYDIVSSPGFSEARLHLNESQIMESIGDNCVYVIESEDNIKKNNIQKPMDNKNLNNNELLEQLAKMSDAIQELQFSNQLLKERLEKQQAKDKRVLESVGNAVQSWIINEYSPMIQKWIVEEYSPKVQGWIVEEYSPKVQDWIVEEYSPKVQDWIVEEYSPKVQDWIVEEYSPKVQSWIVEEYSEGVGEWVQESMKDTKNNKIKSISDTLELLESMNPTKPQFGTGFINENKSTTSENNTSEPLYIREMPADARVKYNMASNEIKESIARRAKIFNFVNEGAIERFWSNIDFSEIQPVNNVYEGLNNISDHQERALRAAFRKNRSNLI